MSPQETASRLRAANKFTENAELLWKVAQDPEIAAKNKDIASKAVNLIGETLPYIAGTTAGYIAAGPLGGFAVGSLVEGNSAYRTAVDHFTKANKGKPLTAAQQSQAEKIGLGVGMVSGAVEAFGGRAAEMLLLRATKKLQNKLAKAGAVFTIGTVIEALEEGAQEVAQITGEETYRDVDWKERVNRTLGSMAGGAFLGGTMRGASVIARGVLPPTLPTAQPPTAVTPVPLRTAIPSTEPAEPTVTPEAPAKAPPTKTEQVIAKMTAKQEGPAGPKPITSLKELEQLQQKKIV